MKIDELSLKVLKEQSADIMQLGTPTEAARMCQRVETERSVEEKKKFYSDLYEALAKIAAENKGYINMCGGATENEICKAFEEAEIGETR